MTTGNPGYSPLPQSNSDSDGSEEEELHISQGNQFSSRSVEVQVSESTKTFTELNKNVINYKPLDDERHVEETFTKFQSSLDEVFIQKSNSSERFSTCRKICFAFSLFLCVFTTVAFMWILPCNIESCPVVEDMKSLVASDSKSDNNTWKKIFPGLEIIGPCSLVSDSFSRNQNIAFLARTYLSSDQKYTENFLFSLKGEDGSLNWHVRVKGEPIVVDCTLIDIDLDGLNDCLLFEKHYITTINSITGKEMWNSYNFNKEVELIFLNFPVMLPDVNNDEVKDLLLSYSFTKNNEKHIAIISGKTGKVIGTPYKIKFCETVPNLKPLNDTIHFFACHNFTKESIHTVNLTDIFKTFRIFSRKKVNFSDWDNLKQHVEHSNTLFAKSLQLILKNQGHCPENCSVLVNIKKEHKGFSNKSIYTFSNRNTFGMTPVKFKSKLTSGFILKFWEWNEETEKFYFENSTLYPKLNFSNLETTTKQMPKKIKNLSAVTDLNQEILSEVEVNVKRDKRTADNSQRQENGTNLRMITETLVRVVFNDTHVNVRQMYKDKIIQICQKPNVCHPDANQQMHSTLVASFNGNEREKLVTFSSKNSISPKSNMSWQMQSKIEMLDCE